MKIELIEIGVSTALILPVAAALTISFMSTLSAQSRLMVKLFGTKNTTEKQRYYRIFY